MTTLADSFLDDLDELGESSDEETQEDGGGGGGTSAAGGASGEGDRDDDMEVRDTRKNESDRAGVRFIFLWMLFVC